MQQHPLSAYATLDVEASAAPAAAPEQRLLQRLRLLRRSVLPTATELEAAATEVSEAELFAQYCDYSELCALLELYLERVGGPFAAATRLHADAGGAARRLQTARLDSDLDGGSGSGGGGGGGGGGAAAALLALRRETLLSQVARVLQAAGCPVWRLEFNLHTVSTGLGCPGTEVAAFPRFTLLSFSRLAASAVGAQTLFVKTARGMNMTKLDAADALCRRAASWGTDSGAPVSLARLYSGEAGRARLAAAAAIGRAELPQRLEAARARYPAGEEAALARDILDFAAYGPGFFHFSAAAAADEEVEWLSVSDCGDSVRAGALFSSSAPTLPPPPLPRASPSGGDVALLLGTCSPPAEAPQALPWRPAGHRARRVAFTSLALHEALQSLEQIDAAPPLYLDTHNVLAMAVSSAGCAPVFFNGGAGEALAAGVLGGLVGVFGVFVGRHGRWLRSFEFVSAVVVSFLARVADGRLAALCLDAVILSSLIWLVQGWTLTNSVVEIASSAQLPRAARGGAPPPRCADPLLCCHR
jgi:uncharacterized membrane protein YjjP (DUF1212 family)